MKKIFFSYIVPNKFSGQTAATVLIIDAMRKRGYNCKTIKLYPLQRSVHNLLKRWFNLFINQAKSVPAIFNLLISKSPVLHITLGQGWMSFLRIAVWLFPVKIIRRDLKVITSLNGSLFMGWAKKDIKTKFFLWFLKDSKFVTVLGEKQKNKLLWFGLDEKKVIIVPNACELKTVTEDFVRNKHSRKKITVLHLSLLIESKGFPEYLETAQLIAKEDLTYNVDFILCGPVSFSSFCSRFTTVDEKTKWIENKIEHINSISDKINVEWIRGAKGKEKEDLFNQAQIFIMPTTFPVEAQPLVLLEAMAGGCSIISSNVGEIETVLNNNNSVLINDVRPEIIKSELLSLIKNREKRMQIALIGLKDIKGSLSLKNYGHKWDKLINEVMLK